MMRWRTSISGTATFILLALNTPVSAEDEAPRFSTAAPHALIAEASTGAILFEKQADVPMAPSSMSKLMVLYELFDRLKDGRLKLKDRFRVSEKAWKMGGSKMFVEVGSEVSVEDLLRGIIVQSGNDACIVVAENLAESEAAFAAQMNKRAQTLGLTHSHFINATGMPEEGHHMSARDLYRLSHRLIEDFADYYPYFIEQTFTYNGISQPNRNPLLDDGLGVDGLKTGHTSAGGYGLAASAPTEEGGRVILVINGLESKRARAEESRRLMRESLRDYTIATLFPQGTKVGRARTWLGEDPRITLVPSQDIRYMIPKTLRERTRDYMHAEYPKDVPAPITRGQKLGELVVAFPGMPQARFPLVAEKDVPRVGWFREQWLRFTKWLSGSTPPPPLPQEKSPGRES